MAEYIDRQALLKKLCDGDSSRMEDYYYNAIAEFPAADVVSKETHEAVQKALIAFAETDVVQVVRCKDCRYWDECRIGKGLCEHPVNGITRDYTIGMDFCSYGERKDND